MTLHFNTVPFGFDIESFYRTAPELKDEIIREVKRAARNEARTQRRILTNDVMGTWGEHPPVRIQTGVTAGDMLYEQVDIDDNIFFFLDQGTSIRYATMSDDWVSETIPYEFKSIPGQGTVMFVNKSVVRPPIEPRHWMLKLYRERRPKFEDAIYQAYYKVLRRHNLII